MTPKTTLLFVEEDKGHIHISTQKILVAASAAGVEKLEITLDSHE